MTAVQQVFRDLEKLHPHLFNVYTTEGKFFINHFHKYLELEKEQIKNAYKFGIQDEYVIGSEQYYNKNFKLKYK